MGKDLRFNFVEAVDAFFGARFELLVILWHILVEMMEIVSPIENANSRIESLSDSNPLAVQSPKAFLDILRPPHPKIPTQHHSQPFTTRALDGRV